MRKRYVVAYDISQARRRRKVERLLCEFGYRMQYSVFEIVATPAQKAGLQQKLKRAIDPATDALNFYLLSEWAVKNSVLQGSAVLNGQQGVLCIG